ncbi:unnamed protein product [Pleuronectes platessa]|uniref:Uncharacterized protein n=1 Tax=Pleuronectes platessa TaxID=8262 RepID=A0A9N7TXP8_PLEPL|nr:unnamed protein product [Pleuronectes platessa]
MAAVSRSGPLTGGLQPRWDLMETRPDGDTSRRRHDPTETRPDGDTSRRRHVPLPTVLVLTRRCEKLRPEAFITTSQLKEHSLNTHELRGSRSRLVAVNRLCRRFSPSTRVLMVWVCVLNWFQFGSGLLLVNLCVVLF